MLVFFKERDKDKELGRKVWSKNNRRKQKNRGRKRIQRKKKDKYVLFFSLVLQEK